MLIPREKVYKETVLAHSCSGSYDRMDSVPFGVRARTISHGRGIHAGRDRARNLRADGMQCWLLSTYLLTFLNISSAIPMGFVSSSDTRY
jgi:hypothetical protein